MPNNPLQSLLNPLHRDANLEEASAAWEQLAMSRKDDIERLQDDLQDAHKALDTMTVERDLERDSRLWTARRLGVIERQAREAFTAVGETTESQTTERLLLASRALLAVIQLAEAARSQRALSSVQESLKETES